MSNNYNLQGPPYDLSGIVGEEILFKLAKNYPADIYFFIWRCCLDSNELQFDFTIPKYFEPKFQMQTVRNLARLRLVEPIDWKRLHKGFERFIPSDIKITKYGESIFQEWLKVSFVSLVINLPHDIRVDAKNFNDYFIQNFHFSDQFILSSPTDSKVEIIDSLKQFKLDGTQKHNIEVVIEYRAKVSFKIKEKIRLAIVLIHCGYCKENFIFTIKPKTYRKYLTPKKALRRGCPNCKYPQRRTRFYLFFNDKRFEVENYFTDKDKKKLQKEKDDKIEEIYSRFNTFILNTTFDSSRKNELIGNFSEEFEDRLKEIKYKSMMLSEFQEFLELFYQQQKKKIMELL